MENEQSLIVRTLAHLQRCEKTGSTSSTSYELLQEFIRKESTTGTEPETPQTEFSVSIGGSLASGAIVGMSDPGKLTSPTSAEWYSTAGDKSMELLISNESAPIAISSSFTPANKLHMSGFDIHYEPTYSTFTLTDPNGMQACIYPDIDEVVHNLLKTVFSFYVGTPNTGTKSEDTPAYTPPALSIISKAIDKGDWSLMIPQVGSDELCLLVAPNGDNIRMARMLRDSNTRALLELQSVTDIVTLARSLGIGVTKK